MAIRFQCGFCTQPIEVDDEWASKTVACPYCRKTITAPQQSTLADLGLIPTATPLAGPTGPSAHSPTAQEHSVTPPPSPPNVVALVAFALACGMVLSAVGLLWVFSAHSDEYSRLLQPGMTFSDQMQAVSDYMASQPEPPLWLVAMAGLEGLIGLLWVATLVCGIIGVRFEQRRHFAVIALVLVGVTPILVCCGNALSLAS